MILPGAGFGGAGVARFFTGLNRLEHERGRLDRTAVRRGREGPRGRKKWAFPHIVQMRARGSLCVALVDDLTSNVGRPTVGREERSS